jgi:signal transduction histidine kinase
MLSETIPQGLDIATILVYECGPYWYSKTRKAIDVMAQPLSETGAPRAQFSPLPPASRVGVVDRPVAPYATILQRSRGFATTSRYARTEVRFAGASWGPALQTENSRLLHELRASRRRIAQAAECERRRLEQDLHDGAQQRLVEIQARLGIAQALADRADLASQLEAIQGTADAALDELRTLARGIHPAALRDLGPAAALRALAQHSVVPIKVIDGGISRSPCAIEAAIYFCAREAIQNTTKHAGPGARVTVTLRRHRDTIELIITDDGVGMSPETASNGIGIVGMRDRIEAVDGQFRIVSHPGLGTCVHATVPDLPAAESDTIASGSIYDAARRAPAGRA